MTYLTLTDFEIICQELKRFFKRNNDPLPIFKHSYFDKLDMVIAAPKRTFDKKDLYADFFEKAACYLYFINKLHPFNNGNKRISIVASGVFIMYNGYEFTAGEELMYQFATDITISQKNQKEEFGETATFIKQNCQQTGSIIRAQFLFDFLKLFRK